jgi:hypothetical protein
MKIRKRIIPIPIPPDVFLDFSPILVFINDFVDSNIIIYIVGKNPRLFAQVRLAKEYHPNSSFSKPSVVQ